MARNKFTQLSYEKREDIAYYRKHGYSLRQIARIPGRSHATIVRELQHIPPITERTPLSERITKQSSPAGIRDSMFTSKTIRFGHTLLRRSAEDGLLNKSPGAFLMIFPDTQSATKSPRLFETTRMF